MFTFKKIKRSTGLASIGEGESTQIKHRKKQVGILSGPSWYSEDTKWRARFCVQTPLKPSQFTWFVLKATFENEEEGRAFLKRNYKALVEKYEFHPLDDD